jgi:hypothetical protein
MERQEAIDRLKAFTEGYKQAWRWAGGPTGPTLPTGPERSFRESHLRTLEAIIEALERGEL